MGVAPSPTDGSARVAEIAEQQPAGDACGLENHRQSAAGMSAAADEVHSIELLEAVAGAEVEHLAEVMGEIEGEIGRASCRESV